MRQIQYLSPSAISTYKKSQEEFYINYLADVKAPRMPQNQVMAVGSAVDAFTKNFLHESLFGKGKDPKFNLITLFEAQVETQNRDYCFEAGKYLFEQYKKSGAVSDLLLELQSSLGTPRFEIEVKGAVNGYREGVTKKMESGVTLLGKPDIFYINKHGVHVILDIKSNGWASRSAPSPMPGYLRIRPGSGPHKNCFPLPFKGTIINCGQFLNDLNIDWARQLAIYGWLCGCDVGDEFIVAIDQLVCKMVGNKYPDVRVAEHRLRIHPDWQWNLFSEIINIWSIVHSNHYFRDMSLEESKARCASLDARAKSFAEPQNEEDAMFNKMMRG